MFKKEKQIDFSRAIRRLENEAGRLLDFAEKKARAGREVSLKAARFAKAEEKIIAGEAREIYDKLEELTVPARSRRQKAARFLRLVFPLAAGLFALFIVLAGISAWMLGNIYLTAMSGKSDLEQAAACIKQGDYDSSISFANQAGIKFKNAGIKADEMSGSVIKYLPVIGAAAFDVKYLLVTANILSRTVAEGARISREISGLARADSVSAGSDEGGAGFSRYTPEEKGRILAYLYESGPEISGLKANLDLAAMSLDQIKFSPLLFPVKGKIQNLKAELDLGREILGRAEPAVRFLPELAGYPEKKSFLFLLENSDELRPAGGFIGNYGIIETKNGDIVRFDTEDSYHLDMPVKDVLDVNPPAPLKKYLVDKWFFRDSNWSPDFPQAAIAAQWFYEKEKSLASGTKAASAALTGTGAGEFSGVIAITPKLITDLLAITGPITLEGHEYNKDNFSELLEYRVEVAYRELGEREWNRKEMVGKIAAELKTRLFDLPAGRWPEIFRALENNIEEKNLLVYFNDCDLEEQAAQAGFAGELKPAAADYLMAVDANLGSYKSDAVIGKNISYKMEEANGRLIATVTANYSHRGGYDWRTTGYRSYTRFYTPAGAKLLSAKGFESEVDTGNSAGEIVLPGAAESGTAPKSCLSAVSDKSYFGGFFTIAPGKIKSLELVYELPSVLYEKLKAGQYELYLQKQPGSLLSGADVELDLARNISAYSPAGFSADRASSGRITWTTDFNTDKMFSITTQ